MISAVYKSRRKADTYLYVVKQEDEATNLDVVPEAVKAPLGELEHVMDVDLSTRDRLARVDIRELKKALEEKGLYIQMPPGHEELAQLEKTLSKL